MAWLLRQRVALAVTGILLLSVAGLSARAGAPRPDAVRHAGPLEYAPGEVLIRFEPSRPIPFGLTPQEMQQAREAIRAEAAAVVSRIGAQVKALASFAPTVRFPTGLHIATVKLPEGMSVEEGRRLLEALPGVVYAEPNYRVYPLEATPQGRGPGGFPNDTFFSSQWALHNTGRIYGTPDADIDAPEAWEREIGERDIVVAVIDTGIQITHPDLAANVWVNPGEIPGNGVDDDLNGYVDDIHGWDFCHDDASVYDSSLYDDHGTHVAGIIGAVTDNSRGVAGVAWNVRIMALKFSGEAECNYTSQAIAALRYAADMKRRYGLRMLTNNSWGNYVYDKALKDAIDATDMLFVAAAGNDTKDNDLNPHYPSSYDSPNIIAVAATDYDDQLAWFSNYGAVSVDLAAPGDWIISTYPESTYDWLSGTSMAAPHVAGAAALAMAHFPGETWAEIKQRILNSVDPLPSLAGKVATGGRLNLLTLINQAPVAKAGPDQTVRGRATVYLDGSASEDPDRDPLTYSWAFTSRPVGSNTSLSDPSSPNPWFVVDQPGTYVLQLTVSDGVLTSAPDSVTITATNTPPVANAGPDQTTHWGRLVELDGSGSYDSDGDALTYRWELVSKPADSTAVLSSTTIVNPTFIADRPGRYLARLVVSDGIVESDPDEVTVTATNMPPVARAGSDQTVRPGSQVQLDGSGSYDPDGDRLTYRWELVSKPANSTATLSSTTAANPAFTADRVGKYVARLVVSDGIAESMPDEVTVTANTPPVAQAGADQIVRPRSQVQLNGSASYDPDGDPLTYRWELVSKPANSTATLSSTTAANPTFTADLAGKYVARLVVSDGIAESNPDEVTVTAYNTPPVANAGPDRYAAVGSVVILSGEASDDPDKDPITKYHWVLKTKPPGSRAQLISISPSGSSTSFTPDLPGTYTMKLTVKDLYDYWSEPDTVTVEAVVAYAAPNPARATVTFYYESGLSGGEVRVYDVAGRLMVTLPLRAGGSTEWNLTDSQGRPLASGLYLWLLFGPDGKPVLSRPERLVIQR